MVATNHPPFTAQQMARELREHNDFFDMFVDLIPSKLYITHQPATASDEANDEKLFASKKKHNNNNKYHKEASKESKHAKRAAAKAEKRRRLDPSQVETTVQKKNRLDAAAATTTTTIRTTSAGGVLPKGPPVHNNPDQSNDEQEDDKKVKNGNHNPLSISPKKKTLSAEKRSHIEALQEQLRAKIAAKRSQRQPSDAAAAGAADGQPQSAEGMSKRAKRKAEKLKRREEAMRKKAKTGESTMTTTKTYKMATALEQIPAARDLATVDFGRLAGLNNEDDHVFDSSGKYLQANKALSNVNKTKNMQKLLSQAEAKQSELQALREQAQQSNDETARAKVQAIQWADALKEADGRRVKDDPTKLKKALKRKAVKKQKSQKAWKSRMEQTQSQKKERQQIRQHNLEARKQGGQIGANLSKKKIIPAGERKDEQGKKKPTASRAGFEGRKQDFLNSGGSSSKGGMSGSNKGKGKQ